MLSCCWPKAFSLPHVLLAPEGRQREERERLLYDPAPYSVMRSAVYLVCHDFYLVPFYLCSFFLSSQTFTRTFIAVVLSWIKWTVLREDVHSFKFDVPALDTVRMFLECQVFHLFELSWVNKDITDLHNVTDSKWCSSTLSVLACWRSIWAEGRHVPMLLNVIYPQLQLAPPLSTLWFTVSH